MQESAIMLMERQLIERAENLVKDHMAKSVHLFLYELDVDWMKDMTRLTTGHTVSLAECSHMMSH